MNFLKIFNINEKKIILNKLKTQFGVSSLDGIFLKRGADRIFLFQGSFNEETIKNLERIIPIERVGIYFGKIQNNELRLSIDGIHLLQNQIKKNIFELDEKQLKSWLRGNELNISTGKKGFLIMKYKDDFIGCGKASEQKITNFIPKNRRLKEKNNKNNL
ncbi:MAG: hypothetical protein KKF68_01960 [Nanoarchaeota archaeon]|nr:hypothetical protein [Nanoarchaeota archaeon]